MDKIQHIEEHLKAIKDELDCLERFRDTYEKAVPEIRKIVLELFEQDSLKKLEDYETLKRKFGERILALISPDNFTQLVIETTLPDIYDPPNLRNKKVTAVKKIVKELKTKGTIEKLSTKKLKETPYPEFNSWGEDAKKLGMTTEDIIEDPATSASSSKKEYFQQGDLEFIRRAKEKHEEELPSPELMPLKIAGKEYSFDPERLLIYESSKDKPNVGVKVGELLEGKFKIGDQEYPIKEEVVIEKRDPESDDIYYQSTTKISSFYELLNKTTGWLVGLSEEQQNRLL